MTGLWSLPVELMQPILAQVGFEGVCNLRLTCRRISHNSTFGLVKSHFAPMELDWTSIEQLREFEQRTLSWKGCLFQGLTITGKTILTGELALDEDEEPKHLEILRRAFRNMRANSLQGGVDSLSVVIRTTGQGDTYDAIRRRQPHIGKLASARSFDTTIDCALSASGLPVHRLHVFAERHRCTLVQDRMGDVVGGLSASVKCANHLSNELSSYNLRSSIEALESYSQRIGLLRQAPSRYMLSNLRTCHLSGICITQVHLLDFLGRLAQIRDLTLEHVNLWGRFWPIFEYLTKSRSLERLHLINLCQGQAYLFFPGQYFEIVWRPGQGPTPIHYEAMMGGCAP